MHYDCNHAIFESLFMTLPTHSPAERHASQASASVTPIRSVLAWPAWLRVLAVLPVVLTLWLAVWWANEGVALW